MKIHDQTTTALLRARLEIAAALEPGERDDRGDVPGWVMVTVMSAGIVAGLIGIAKPELQAMLRSALNSVK